MEYDSPSHFLKYSPPLQSPLPDFPILTRSNGFYEKSNHPIYNTMISSPQIAQAYFKLDDNAVNEEKYDQQYFLKQVMSMQTENGITPFKLDSESSLDKQQEFQRTIAEDIGIISQKRKLNIVEEISEIEDVMKKVYDLATKIHPRVCDLCKDPIKCSETRVQCFAPSKKNCFMQAHVACIVLDTKKRQLHQELDIYENSTSKKKRKQKESLDQMMSKRKVICPLCKKNIEFILSY